MSLLLWHHHQKRRWDFDPRRRYAQAEDFSDSRWQLKPHGLYLSVEEGPRDGWWNWCGDENHHSGDRWRTALRIDVDGLLVVRHPSEAQEYVRNFKLSAGLDGYDYIDWRAVARDCGGILVMDYRNCPDDDPSVIPPTWWYAWDCSSACVWDLSSAVIDTGPTEPVVFRESEYA